MVAVRARTERVDRDLGRRILLARTILVRERDAKLADVVAAARAGGDGEAGAARLLEAARVVVQVLACRRAARRRVLRHQLGRLARLAHVGAAAGCLRLHEAGAARQRRVRVVVEDVGARDRARVAHVRDGHAELANLIAAARGVHLDEIRAARQRGARVVLCRCAEIARDERGA